MLRATSSRPPEFAAAAAVQSLLDSPSPAPLVRLPGSCSSNSQSRPSPKPQAPSTLVVSGCRRLNPPNFHPDLNTLARHLALRRTHSPRCLSRSAIRRWMPYPPRKYSRRCHQAHRCKFWMLPSPPPPPLQKNTIPTRTRTMDVLQSNVRPTSTPQNTPANAAPISSRAQQPGVGTIKEGTWLRERVEKPCLCLFGVAAPAPPTPPCLAVCRTP